MKKIFRIIIMLTLITSLFAQEAAPKFGILKSMLLPGWGELSYKSKSAYVFMGAEAALWIGFAGLRYSGYVQNEDMINYARLNAGVVDYPEGNGFWSDLGDYMSYDDHREDMLENRTPENIYDTDYQWNWQTEDDLLVFERLFRNKELTLLASEFVLTGMIVNRLASVINVQYLKNKDMQLSAFASPVKGGAYMQIALNF
jgi:hypothetical protein